MREFKCKLKITFGINYVIFYVTLTLYSQYTFQCNNCLVLIAYQDTIHKESLKYPSPKSMQTINEVVDLRTLS